MLFKIIKISCIIDYNLYLNINLFPHDHLDPEGIVPLINCKKLGFACEFFHTFCPASLSLSINFKN